MVVVCAAVVDDLPSNVMKNLEMVRQEVEWGSILGKRASKALGHLNVVVVWAASCHELMSNVTKNPHSVRQEVEWGSILGKRASKALGHLNVVVVSWAMVHDFPSNVAKYSKMRREELVNPAIRDFPHLLGQEVEWGSILGKRASEALGYLNVVVVWAASCHELMSNVTKNPHSVRQEVEWGSFLGKEPGEALPDCKVVVVTGAVVRQVPSHVADGPQFRRKWNLMRAKIKPEQAGRLSDQADLAVEGPEPDPEQGDKTKNTRIG